MYMRLSCECIDDHENFRKRNSEQPVKVSSKKNFPLLRTRRHSFDFFDIETKLFLPTRLISQLIVIKFILFTKRAEGITVLHIHTCDIQMNCKIKNFPPSLITQMREKLRSNERKEREKL